MIISLFRFPFFLCGSRSSGCHNLYYRAPWAIEESREFYLPMKHHHFDLKLSLAIDACHAELDTLRTMRNTPRKIARLIVVRCRLWALERRVPA